MLERLFHLRAHGTNVRTELVAGLTTFLTMAYIVFVNPDILAAAGMPREAVFVAKIGDGPIEKLAAIGVQAVADYAYESIEDSLLDYVRKPAGVVS